MKVKLASKQPFNGGILFEEDNSSIIDINIINFIRLPAIDDVCFMRDHLIKNGIISKDKYENLNVNLSVVGLHIIKDLGYSGVVFDNNTIALLLDKPVGVNI